MCLTDAKQACLGAGFIHYKRYYKGCNVQKFTMLRKCAGVSVLTGRLPLLYSQGTVMTANNTMTCFNTTLRVSLIVLRTYVRLLSAFNPPPIKPHQTAGHRVVFRVIFLFLHDLVVHSLFIVYTVICCHFRVLLAFKVECLFSCGRTLDSHLDRAARQTNNKRFLVVKWAQKY